MAGSTPEQVRKMRQSMGRRAAELRRAHNPKWTQFDLAIQSVVRPETISRIERGATDFQISHILRIADALKSGRGS